MVFVLKPVIVVTMLLYNKELDLDPEGTQV